MRRCMLQLDVAGAREIWRRDAPHLPQPATDEEVLATLHVARTSAASIPDKLRFYSHAWLVERGLPSRLPDALKPRAERMYPRVVDAVGICVKATSPLLKPIAAAVQAAMGVAVEEAYADGRKEPEYVRARMQEARVKQLRSFGLNAE